MNKYFILIVIVLLSVQSLSAQSASKLTSRANKAFKESNFPEAGLNSIGALRINPKKKKAQEILSKSYSLAMEDLENEIRELKKKSGTFIGDKTVFQRKEIFEKYQMVQSLDQGAYDISRLIKNSKYPLEFERFNVQEPLEEAEKSLAEARTKAAELHYKKGLELKALGGLENNKKAAKKFRSAQFHVAEYKDSAELYRQARKAGTTRIAIIPFVNKSGNYNLGRIGETLSDKLISDLSKRLEGREFLEVVDFNRVKGRLSEHDLSFSQEIDGTTASRYGAATNVHYFITGKITQVNVGTPSVQSSNPKKVTSEVVVGQETYINDKGKKKKRNVYGNAYAEVIRHTKEQNTSVSGAYNLINAITGETLETEAILGRYYWSSCWITYSGDKRAVSYSGCTEKELSAPSHQILTNSALDNIIAIISPKIATRYKSFR